MMLVMEHALDDVRSANEAWDRAHRRLEALERQLRHFGVGSGPQRTLRVRAALTAFYEAEATLHAAAEREHRWFMARVRRSERRLPRVPWPHENGGALNDDQRGR